MSKKVTKILYWVFTGLLSVMMLMSAGMYFVNYEEVSSTFEQLGHPVYIIYPLALLKILGVIAITTRFSKTITEWAYAGFCFNFLLAFAAHYHANDGEHFGALIAIILLFSSYFLGKKIKE